MAFHIVGPVGPHVDTLRIAYQRGARFFVQVNPEPGDGAVWRSFAPDAFLVARFAGGQGTGLADNEIQAGYEANPVEYANHIWATHYLPRMNAAGITLYDALLWNNEPGLGDGAIRAVRLNLLCRFTDRAIELGQSVGIGTGLFNFSRGVPELDEWALLHNTMRKGLAVVIRGKRRCFLSLHQYGSPDGSRGPGSLFVSKAWHILRFELQVRPNLPADLKLMKYGVTETGPDGQPGGWRSIYGDQWPSLVADMQTYAYTILGTVNCLGFAFFTVHQEGGFYDYDIRGTPLFQALATINYPLPRIDEGGGGGMPDYIELWSDHWSDRLGQRPKYIVWHTSEGNADATPEDTADFLQHNDRGVSSHFLFGLGTTWRMVSDARAAHTAESPTSRLPGGEPQYLTNELTLNLELFRNTGGPHSVVDQRDTRNAIIRTAEWCRTWGITLDRIISHQVIDPTRRTDPVGINMATIRQAVGILLNGQTDPNDAGAFSDFIKDAQVLSPNRQAAITRVAIASGYQMQLSNEKERTESDGRIKVGQLWIKFNGDGSTTEAVFWAYKGDWGNIRIDLQFN